MREKIIPIIYLVLALLTFGHAANNSHKQFQMELAACEQGANQSMCGLAYADESPLVGAVSAALWPLYWSWELFEMVDGQPLENDNGNHEANMGK